MIDLQQQLQQAALEDCLQQMQTGVSLIEALARYPQWAKFLKPRLEAAQAARSLRATLHVPPAAQSRSRARFLAAAQKPARSGFLFSFAPVRRTPMMLLALMLSLLLGAFGTVAASAQSLPGEALYPLKLATENTRLLFTTDPAQRRELAQAFDHNRVQEVYALLQRGRSVRVTFAGALTQSTSGEWQVAGIRLALPSDVLARGEARPGYYVDVVGVPQPDQTVLVEELHLRPVEFSGNLQALFPDHWIVGDVNVDVTPETSVRGSPVIGRVVQVHALVLGDGALQAQVLEVIGAALEPTETATNTVPPTATSTPTSTSTLEATASATFTPRATSSPIASASPQKTKTRVTFTRTPEPTSTPTPSTTLRASATATPSQTPTREPTQSPSPTATHYPYPTPTATYPPKPTATHYPYPTGTQYPYPTATHYPYPTPTATYPPEPTATHYPYSTPTPTKPNTPPPPTATSTPNGSYLCASPTVITDGGSYAVAAGGTCFKYVNTTFTWGGVWSVINGSDTTVSNIVKWYGGRNETVTACVADSQTLNGSGAQLNNFTVAKGTNGAMYVLITTNKANTVSLSIQNWQNGAGCA
jgi:hypothetical protein